MDDHARGTGRRRRRLLDTNLVLPKATQRTPQPLGARDLPPEDEQTTEPSRVAPIPPPRVREDQDTDLTGRPGTPSTVRRRVAARGRGPRSLLGPEAYQVGAGIRPQTTDITLLLDEADRPTEVGVDPEGPPATVVAARMSLDEWEGSEQEVTPVTDARADTDPFGIDLPADEIDLLARSGASMPEWENPEPSFFERETQPLARGSRPSPAVPPLGIGAAIAVVAFGFVAVIALTISAWIALSQHPGSEAAAQTSPPPIQANR